jgi:hypothetical protein
MRLLWVATVLGVVLWSVGPMAQQPPPPPVFKTGLKLPDFYVHDPWILAHAESRTYYLYVSGRVVQDGQPRAGVVAYTSSDLETWAGPKPVFAVPDGLWANPRHGAWAPEVHRYRDKYYLLVTLHNNDRLIDQPDDRPVYLGRLVDRHLRGTQIFVGDSPEGPFLPLGNAPAPPADFMTLDGTLYVEHDVPYMVYAHEWIQVLDGTMEAVRLEPDLSAAAGEPFYLFKGSDAPWWSLDTRASKENRIYVTDGPELYRTKAGHLLMLWSSYRDGLYVQTLARSLTGKLRGPWVQGDILVDGDSGHGMLFTAFDGRLMLVLHQPFRNARGKLFEVDDAGHTLRIVRQTVH